MKRLISIPALIVATSIAGCSSNPDSLDDSMSFGQWAATEVVSSLVAFALDDDDDSCGRPGRRKCSDDSFSASFVCAKEPTRAQQACYQQHLRADTIKSAEERKEARRQAEAVQRAFGNRGAVYDTATMIEEQRRRNDWIGNSENQPSIIVIKKDQFE